MTSITYVRAKCDRICGYWDVTAIIFLLTIMCSKLATKVLENGVIQNDVVSDASVPNFEQVFVGALLHHLL